MRLDRAPVTFDIASGCSVTSAFLFLFAVSKLYHGYWGPTFHDVELVAYLLISVAMLISISVGRGCGSTLLLAGRLWMLLGALLALSVGYGDILQWKFGRLPYSLTVAGCAGLCLLAASRVAPANWIRIRRTVALVPWLVVLLPMAYGHLAASPIKWLNAPQARQLPGTVTIVLLFDEMNAGASRGLRDVLARHGLVSDFKAIAPIYGSTTEVIPAMFSRLDFAGAQACGLTHICSGHAAMDFSSVTVGRNDVDVVGFHHPYCAIQGLRFCQRLTTNQSLWDEGRWGCGVLHRIGLDVGLDRDACEALSHRTWEDLRQRVIQALFEAPALTKGGVLYAHIPLPHPPASSTGSLAEQYEANVRASEQLLNTILDKAEANRLTPRIVIFADHPLRQAMWCGRESAQFDAPCQVAPELVDAKVPLLVAAKRNLPAIAAINSNREIFDVVSGWLDR